MGTKTGQYSDDRQTLRRRPEDQRDNDVQDRGGGRPIGTDSQEGLDRPGPLPRR